MYSLELERAGSRVAVPLDNLSARVVVEAIIAR